MALRTRRGRAPARRSAVLGVITAVFLAVAATIALGGCSSSASRGAKSGGGGTSTASGRTATVDVKNFAFTPKTLTVARGTTVTWKFEDAAQHTVQADNGSFHSKPLNDGRTYSYTFDTPGTYSYICSIHQYMTGKIVVR